MTANPYESPKTVSSVPTHPVLSTTRWKAGRAGMRRGAKLGFLAGIITWFVSIIVMVGVRLFLDGGRLPSDLERAAWLDIAKGLGMFMIGLCVLGIVCGAIPGAAILGTIAAVRWRPAETAQETQL
jgi:hypothetical protein